VINILAVTACLLTMVSSYLVAHGRLKPVYVLGVVNGSLYLALNVSIALSAREQAGVMLLAIPSAWGVAMAIVGLRRLRRER
jgi:hypothetical protein